MSANKLITIMIIVLILCVTGGLLTNQYMDNRLKTKAIDNGCSVSKDMIVTYPNPKSTKP